MLLERVLNIDHWANEPSVLDNSVVSFTPLSQVLLFICVMHVLLNLNCPCYLGIDVYVDIFKHIMVCMCVCTCL